MKYKSILPLLGATLLMASCANHSTKTSIALSGAGATFPEPFYTMVFDNFNTAHGHTISYGGIGSGGGVRNLQDKIVDFAASDAFLSDEEMSSMEPVIHIPTCMGAVVLAYNLPGIYELNLSGDLIADIYAGKVTRWNDARIAALNPEQKLPDENIIPMFRSDGSGTTNVFTYYLSQVSDSWKADFGYGKSVDFPVGQAAKGNPGVASLVSETPYSIGYVGSEYAFAQRLSMATLMNVCGNLVKPTIESISAAAQGDMAPDTRTMITNSNDPDAYPISCLTWIIIYRDQNYSNRSLDQAKATLELLHYILSEQTQAMAKEVNYAPLPKKLIDCSLKNLEEVQFDGKAISLN